MSGARRALAATALVALVLAACDSSNDDDGMNPPIDPAPSADLDLSGDFAAIAARGNTDDPFALDTATLDADLAARFGGADGEPLDIDDVEDAVTVANRGR